MALFSEKELMLMVESGESLMVLGDSNPSAPNSEILSIKSRWNGNETAKIGFYSGSDYFNRDEGFMTFSTAFSGLLSESMRIEADRKVGIGDFSVNGSLKGRFHVQGQPGLSLSGNGPSADADIGFFEGKSGQAAGITIKSDSNQNGALYFSTTGFSNGKEAGLVYAHGNAGGSLSFIAKQVERLKIDSTGGLVLGNPNYSGNHGSALVMKVTGSVIPSSAMNSSVAIYGTSSGGTSYIGFTAEAALSSTTDTPSTWKRIPVNYNGQFLYLYGA